MRFSVTYRSVNAAQQTGPSADVSASDKETVEIDAVDAVSAAKEIQQRSGRSPGGIDILAVEPDRRVKSARPAPLGARFRCSGTMTAYEATVAPHRSGPVALIHRTWDEAFSVLAGEERVAPAGSFVFVPHGVLHTFWNAGTEPARQLTVFTPSGVEDFFDALIPMLAEGGEETAEAIVARSELYDMIVPPTNRPPYGPLDEVAPVALV